MVTKKKTNKKKNERKPEPLLMFSNKNICPSLQTAHISLHLCVSPCRCFHSDQALFSSCSKTFFCQQKSSGPVSNLKTFVSSSNTRRNAHTVGGGGEVAGRPLTPGPPSPRHRGAVDAADRGGVCSLCCLLTTVPKIAALCCGEAADLLQITFLRPAGQTLNEVNFPKKGLKASRGRLEKLDHR